MNQQTNRNATSRILIASLAGTTIEFFDFYIYALASVIVFPKLFFPSTDPTSGVLESLITFALAFVARPIGSILFGHFGDRLGRKATLVASLMTMGISTIAIGCLPTYSSIGIAAPILLALFRLGQGIGLGGEWGGAVLLATENAPEGKKAWYGMFPQLGSPLGFTFSLGLFLLINSFMTNEQFIAFGWRIPFILSFLLVGVGLYVRLKIIETPEFLKVEEENTRVKFPLADVFTKHARALTLGTLLSILIFVFFYLMTVFTLSWGTTVLQYTRTNFFFAQLISMVFYAVGIITSAVIAGRYSARKMLIASAVIIFVFGLCFSRLFVGGNWPLTVVFLSVAMFLVGLNYGPLGTALTALFPANVRYTGSSLAFTLAGIIGASLTPYFATHIGKTYGLAYVGYYLCLAAMLCFIALLLAKSVMHDE
jgi:MFS family permease